ncbi:glycoside hydrolase, partial [Phlyctochytrium arcticum]
NDSLFWGTYRPNLYFGTRSRAPETVLTGLMWFGASEISGETLRNIRHSCEQGDNLDFYSWLKHDGRGYGHQKIVDSKNGVVLYTEFVKNSEGKHTRDSSLGSGIRDLWFILGLGMSSLEKFRRGYDLIYRIGAPGTPISVIYYTGTSDGSPIDLSISPEQVCPNNRNSAKKPVVDGFSLDSCWGTRRRCRAVSDAIQQNIFSAAQARLQQAGREWAARDVFLMDEARAERPNAVVVQRMVVPPFEVPMSFLEWVVLLACSNRSLTVITNAHLTSQIGPRNDIKESLSTASLAYDRRFTSVFNISTDTHDPAQVEYAQALVSNLIGGIGYFHGTSIVDRSHKNDVANDADDYFGDDEEDGHHDPVAIQQSTGPKEEGPYSLFTAVPSRPFFPRGFLWDEGFHSLLVGEWDSDLSLEILQHWLNLIDENGWVAREQILGEEARSKVPGEFQTQYPDFANPPTLIFGVNAFLKRFREYQNSIESIEQTLPEDTINNQYTKTPSLGTSFLKTAYKKLRRQYEFFRETQYGESGDAGDTLTGFRWRGRNGIHTLTSGLDDYPRVFPPSDSELHVDLLSWMMYFSKSLKEVATELGMEADVKTLEEDRVQMMDLLLNKHWDAPSSSFTDLTRDENGTLIPVIHKGYITLFPLLLGLLSPDSPHLGALLNLIHDPAELWTEYGVASLSQRDAYFGTGENYWRGPVWLNINYLVLESLWKNYMNHPGPYQTQAKQIYTELRDRLMKNIFKEYQRTGYVWEQYSPIDGTGKRSHPFTGWTSLIVLIMAEMY